VGEGAVAVVDDDAVGALAEAGDVCRRERVIGIAVVGQHVDRGRAAFRNRGAIVVRHRRIVDRGDGYRHRCGVAAASAVADGVGITVARGLGAVVCVGEGAVVVVGDGAVRALAESGDAGGVQGAVDVAVVAQHIDGGHRAAFRNRGGIVVGHRGVVDR